MVSPDTQTTSGRVCSPPGRVFCRGFQVQGFPLLWLHTLGFTKNLHNVALQANPSCELVKVYGLKKMSTFLVDNKKKYGEHSPTKGVVNDKFSDGVYLSLKKKK